MPSAPSSPTPCPPWDAWALRAPRYGAATAVGVLGVRVGSGAHCSPAPSQVALATYSYRSLPWLLLNRSSDLPAVLEQIRTMRYEEPSGNAIGEGLRWEPGQQLVEPR